MSVPKPQPHTVEEYLALERLSEERHEYLDGLIYAMAGESPEHGIVCVNLTRIVSTQLLGTPCQVFSKDMKVRSGPDPRSRRLTKGLFSYPDLIVVCGEFQFHDKHRDVLLNPTVIIEVLSPTTEAFDRGEKFWRYRTHLPSLKDYVMVAQSIPMIDHYVHRDGEWVLSTVSGLESSLKIASIDCSLSLADVYDRISFPREPLLPTERRSPKIPEP
jgi:Uma2 family endonuclease